VLSGSSVCIDHSFENFSLRDIFIIVPLHHEPVYKDGLHGGSGRSVGLVDPLDMLPFVYQLAKAEFVDQMEPHFNPIASIVSRLCPSTTRKGIFCIEDPVRLWTEFITIHPIDHALCDDIESELKSSFFSQISVFENPPRRPTLHSSSIIWEQSLVTGHPTHPMHRARLFDSNFLEYDWYHPSIRFVGVPRADLEVKGDFVRLCRCLAAKAAKNAGRRLQDDPTFVYMPVHELQIENIRSRMGNLRLLDPEISLRAQAHCSIRTVEIPGFPDMAFKLSVGVKISSALRTISHFTADFGPRFSRDIVPKLAVDSEILHIELETSSAVYRTTDPDVAKHLTAVIREKYRTPNGQTVVVVAALLDMNLAELDENISVLEHVFELDSEKKKAAFLDRYIQLACRAFLPPLIKNGVAFEAHAQNVLARFDIASKELRGFVIRDLGGLRVHPHTLRESTDVDFQFLDGHVVATKTLEEIFPKFYHTFIHNHLQRLVRLLGMHYNGRGWKMVWKYMAEVIPFEHPVWRLWMDPTCKTTDSKCLMRMRMRNSYRDMVYTSIPNLVQYRPPQANLIA